MHSSHLDLDAVLVFLVVAGVIVPVFHRLKVSPILGFLLVGLLIGPHGLGRLVGTFPQLNAIVITEVEAVRAVGELGVVLLLFAIGLELSLPRLFAMRRLVFGLGGGQIVITAVVIGAIALAFGNSPAAATLIGASLALSSTAVVMQILTQNGRLGSPTGRASFAVLLCQDLAVVPILFLSSALGPASGLSVWQALASSLGAAAVTIAGIMLAGRVLIRPFFHFVGQTGSREFFMAAVLLTIVATALASEAGGLSMALGAFLAGLVLADTEYRHQVAIDIEPFRGLFLGLFFLSVGMMIDIAAIADRPLWLLASVVGLFAIKGVILIALARLFGIERAAGLETAILLGQAGEFGFVVVGSGLITGVIPADVAQFMLLVTALSLAVTPLAARLARAAATRSEAADPATRDEPRQPAGPLAGHVVVAGYGRVGQMLGSLLEMQSIPHVAIDTDAGTVTAFRAAGRAIHFGDASRPEMLERLHIEQAIALVVTINSTAGAERIVEAARRASPLLPVYVRARDVDSALRLVRHGATRAIPETVEASLQLGEAVLVASGVPSEAARALVEQRRAEEEARLAGAG